MSPTVTRKCDDVKSMRRGRVQESRLRLPKSEHADYRRVLVNADQARALLAALADRDPALVASSSSRDNRPGTMPRNTPF